MIVAVICSLPGIYRIAFALIAVIVPMFGQQSDPTPASHGFVNHRALRDAIQRAVRGGVSLVRQNQDRQPDTKRKDSASTTGSSVLGVAENKPASHSTVCAHIRLIVPRENLDHGIFLKHVPIPDNQMVIPSAAIPACSQKAVQRDADPNN